MKKVFLEISQKSLENTCVRVSFLMKLQASGLFSCEFCEISKNTLFHRTPLVAASRPKLKDFEEKYDVQVLLKEKVSLHKK